ncbi:hypothetical protein RISK_000044 [Rhodopirellula islandica]|uniref:Uncharacterized protein n=1 Tax=Rhodopirellula islandica TaxID=595434 RepID=A0A0J1BMZ2_RHOIS|nr:hypothetical protein [Rhodopirellula islandica]KLU07865.1 hypothetical protein RISK_000044 [Rhodopirellula islandica]
MQRFMVWCVFGISLIGVSNPIQRNHVFAETMDGSNRQLIQSLIAVNLSAKQAAGRGEFRLQCIGNDGATVRVCDAELRCGEDAFAMTYEVREGATLEEAEKAEERTGRIIRWKTTLVFVDDTRKTAFISYNTDHTLLDCYLVQPSQCYFTYMSEISMEDILTSKGTWDFGERSFDFVESDETIQVQLLHPTSDEPATIEFSKSHGGLFTKFDHPSSKAAARRIICEWDEVGGVAYAKNLEYRNLGGGDVSPRTAFSLKVLEFQPNCGLQKSECRLASLNLGSEYTQTIAYQNGRSKVIAAELNPEDELKNLVDRIKVKIGRKVR